MFNSYLYSFALDTYDSGVARTAIVYYSHQWNIFSCVVRVPEWYRWILIEQVQEMTGQSAHEFYSLRLYLPSVVAMLKHACLTFRRVKSCSWLSWVGFFSVTPGDCWDSTLKQAINTFFLVPTNLQFMNTLPIKRISLTLKPSNITINSTLSVVGSDVTVKPQSSNILLWILVTSRWG